MKLNHLYNIFVQSVYSGPADHGHCVYLTAAIQYHAIHFGLGVPEGRDVAKYYYISQCTGISDENMFESDDFKKNRIICA